MSGAHTSMTGLPVLPVGRAANPSICAHLHKKVGEEFYPRARLIQVCAYDSIVELESDYTTLYNIRKFMLNTAQSSRDETLARGGGKYGGTYKSFIHAAQGGDIGLFMTEPSAKPNRYNIPSSISKRMVELVTGFPKDLARIALGHTAMELNLMLKLLSKEKDLGDKKDEVVGGSEEAGGEEVEIGEGQAASEGEEEEESEDDEGVVLQTATPVMLPFRSLDESSSVRLVPAAVALIFQSRCAAVAMAMTQTEKSAREVSDSALASTLLTLEDSQKENIILKRKNGELELSAIAWGQTKGHMEREMKRMKSREPAPVVDLQDEEDAPEFSFFSLPATFLEDTPLPAPPISLPALDLPTPTPAPATAPIITLARKVMGWTRGALGLV